MLVQVIFSPVVCSFWISNYGNECAGVLSFVVLLFCPCVSTFLDNLLIQQLFVAVGISSKS